MFLLLVSLCYITYMYASLKIIRNIIFYSYEVGKKWNVMDHTCKYTTDAYGTLEFQGTGEGDKSRVCFDLYIYLFIYIVITFYGIRFC